MIKKFMNRQPKELNPEELLELITSITLQEHQRNGYINSIQSYEDTAQEMITYFYEKSAKGKTGMKELQEQYTMPHFINILHMEARNSINYILRKKKTQRQLFNTDSLDKPVVFDSNGEPKENLVDNIADESDLKQVDIKIELMTLLSRIDNTEDSAYTIKYNEKDSGIFSYRKLAKVYSDLSNNKRLSAKDFEGTIYETKTGRALTKEEINPILTGFRQYIKENQILGGTII